MPSALLSLRRRRWRYKVLFVMLALILSVPALPAQPVFAQDPAVTIVTPDDGAILYGPVLLRAQVSGTTVSSVEFFYDPHEADDPEVSLGLATFNSTNGLWELDWDTTAYNDTYNNIDVTDENGTVLFADTDVNLTKPPTQDSLRVSAVTGAGTLGALQDVRIQNMLTARIFLPDNTDDVRGFQDLETLVTTEANITSVRYDVYPVSAIDPRIPKPFGEFESLGEPIVAAQYGRNADGYSLGDPVWPTGFPAYEIGEATQEGSRRWVFRGWDTTTVPDGEYSVVVTATDDAGRRATYMIITYIVNDLRVKITAPDEGDTVSRFVALEARTSSLTGADNAAPGSLWPATAVNFTIGSTTIPAVEDPAGTGRWRAVWDGDAFAPGPYAITATATNANPNGPETATDTINVNLVAPSATLDAFFPFDWSNCIKEVCSFLDGSGGGPTSWLWDFGDGNTSTAQLPVHTYANYGVYTVSLTVSNGTDTDTYSRVIPVGNTGVVSFNRNGINETPTTPATEFIDWTSAFKNFTYNVGDTLAIPVMWETTVGSATFAALPTAVCDDDETTPNQECVIFTPEEAFGTAPTLVGAAEDGVLFTMTFTEVQYRGVTDIFKGKVNTRIELSVDLGDGSPPQTNWLGTNVDVTNSGAASDESTVVKITAPAEGQFVGGSSVPVKASVVSSVTPTSVEFFVNGTTSIGVDTNGADGWSRPWNTLLFADGPYQLTAVASFGSLTATSAARNVTVNNAVPPEPTPPASTFQIGRVSDTTGQFLTFATEIEEAAEEPGGGGGGGGQPDSQPSFNASMTAAIVPGSITVLPGDGLIGGDAIEFDVVLTNTSTDPGAIMTAYAFQSKVSESPALASRMGDKAFYGVLVADAHPSGPMISVKKNGTANGLFSGRWKGICINSSSDFLPEFNSGLQDESLECAGNRADANFDGLPELQNPPVGIAPGSSQTVRVRIEAGTTDGALHIVEPGTLQGRVVGTPFVGPNGLTYFVPEIDPTFPGNVLAIPDFGDNKVLRNADGTFNPTFAPLADGLTFQNQQYLTLPRRNFAFTDILGRNHTCATYGLDHLNGIPCTGNPTLSPVFGFTGVGDLRPGIQNFAAILHGFGEFAIDADGNPILDLEGNYTPPNFPYDVPCVNVNNSDGLRCGARPYTPIAEFYKANPDGTLTQQMVGGVYGALGGADQYTAFFDTATAEDWKEEIIPEPDPGAPPTGPQLSTSASGQFYDLTVLQGTGINGGDQVEFTIDIINTSRNPDAWLTAFNYQTKQRNLADIGGLDGFTQDRRDIRLDSTLPPCTSLSDGQCFNSSLGIGHFPNVIGNGLLFGQMVWQTDNIDRAGQTIVGDFVAVAPSGIDPVDFQLESAKKNGPFSPILKGNTNFICVKSGLFAPDQDADAACAGQAAELINPDGELVPSNISRRLGLAPGQVQSVRIRQEFGDFRGAVLQVVAGTLTDANFRVDYASTRGLARQFDCEDQRELEYCHPYLVGQNINYLPNTTATWLTPATLEEIEWVIINQPGDAPRIMNFQDNFGYILAMAGFIPTAEFYAPDPNPLLVGTPDEGILIRQQVLGSYAMTTVTPAAPTITSLPVTSGATGVAYSYNVEATGAAPLTFSLDVAPSGMTIDASTGLISWTPTTAGTYDVTVRATNGVGSDTQSFQIEVVTVATAPAITSTPNTAGTTGSAYSYQVTATGSPAPTFSLSVAPSGMTIDASTGLISWTPTTAGTYDVTVVATNGVSPDATQSFQIVVVDPIVITSSPVVAGMAGSAYSYQVTASGSPAPTFSLSTAPSGMTINSTTGLVSWPSPVAGLHNVTVVATNGAAPDASQSFQVSIVAILDNFNRANGNLGSNWIGVGDFKIVNQQVDVNYGGAVAWKTGFNAAQEAAMTITTVDSLGHHGLLLKVQQKYLSTSGIAVIYLPSQNKIVVEAKEPLKLPKTVGSFPATLTNGTRLGARALADGKVEVYVNQQLIGTANAGSYFVNRKGHIGLWYLLATNAWLDDFNGGNIATGSVMAAEAEEINLIDDLSGFTEAWYSGEEEEGMTDQIFMPVIDNR
jgi:PKD repeat protein